MLTAIQILAAKTPEEIFSRENLMSDYKDLIKAWHPDACPKPEAKAVFEKIFELYNIAKKKLDTGIWEKPGTRLVETTTGKKYEISYFSKRPFELGEILIGHKFVTYMLEPQYKDLYDKGTAAIQSFSFPDDRIRADIGRYLPSNKAQFATKPNPIYPSKHTLVVSKTPDLILLSDVLEFLGCMDVKHVAWILSSLFNIACWLEWSGIGHNAISPDTVFISPEHHSIALLGGWWYVSKIGDKLKALPSRTASAIPRIVLEGKISDLRIDQTLIRLLGKELLKESPDIKNADGSISPTDTILSWLRIPSVGRPRDEYRDWSGVRSRALGPRKFIPLDLTEEDIYPQLS